MTFIPRPSDILHLQSKSLQRNCTRLSKSLSHLPGLYTRASVDYSGQISVANVKPTRGSIRLLEHLNINIQSLEIGRAFYIEALGCKADPRVQEMMEVNSNDPNSNLLWANIGLQQFHLPVGAAEHPQQVLRGVIGLVYPDIDELKTRLLNAEDGLAHTRFSWSEDEESEDNGHHETPAPRSLHITCPYGNRFHAQEQPQGHWLTTSPDHRNDPSDASLPGLPGGRSLGLGLQYVRFDAPLGSANLIAAFYQHYLDIPARCIVDVDGVGRKAVIEVNGHQNIEFVEVADVADYDGHHLALYISNFEDAYERCAKDELVYNNPRFPHLVYDTLETALELSEFRTLHIVNPLQPSEIVYTLEHEVRNLDHTGYVHYREAVALDE